MKKAFLLLSAGVLLAACDSGYKQDGPDQMSASKQAGTEKTDELNTDSTAGTNVAAVTNQMQVDTGSTKIGTGATGSPHDKGAKLMASADCASCHRERDKLLGPAYTAVAQKYPATPANVNMLATKIIKGGSGHWGDIAMTPHPALSQTDAQEMVRYILSLK
ncbi:c-type cytochrome [Hymenobacter cheonanensis]|uniref:c-type cytochrome n=1 Tax=Hymenobacter sp. CA2-7 TaxID=3063993 RepID=UPI00271301C1|nr:c-type cytochrome [Hymenobacter sp. CA2-7]MDO7885063.1 c-type cytochrome [Hymenobacter sp. CA2-7]